MLSYIQRNQKQFVVLIFIFITCMAITMIRYQVTYATNCLATAGNHVLASIDQSHNNNNIRRRRNRRRRKPNANRNVLFIVGQGRVGSTLLGELFNQHDEFLYFYEPLRSVENAMKFHNRGNRDPVKGNAYLKEIQEFIKDIMTCKFRERHDKYLRNLDVARHLYKSKKMLTTPLFSKSENRTSYQRVNSALMNKLCMLGRNLTIVIKILVGRLPHSDISFFQNVLLYGRQISLLHLVRDPRAVLYSMKRLRWFGRPGTNEMRNREDFYLAERCLSIINNIKYGLNNRKSKTSIRYALLRYEDIRMENIKKIGHCLSCMIEKNMLRHIYSYFLGKINRNTSSSRKKVSTSKNIYSYSTASRDINEVHKKWREKIDYEFVRKIQYICYDVMHTLGYNTVPDEKTLRTTSKVLYGDLRLREVDLLEYKTPTR